MAKKKEVKRKISELNAELERIENQEKEILEVSKTEIQRICERNNLFCGIVLTPDDIANIVNIALKSKENVRIEFSLYLEEKEEVQPTQFEQ